MLPRMLIMGVNHSFNLLPFRSRKSWRENWSGRKFNAHSRPEFSMFSDIWCFEEQFISRRTPIIGGGCTTQSILFSQSSGWLILHFQQHLHHQKGSSTWTAWSWSREGRSPAQPSCCSIVLKIHFRMSLDQDRVSDLIVCKDFWMSRRSLDSYRLCELCPKFPAPGACYKISCTKHNKAM